MSSSKKKTNRQFGTPPSRTRSPNSPISGFGFPLPAAVALDIPRIQGVWREWHRAGVVDRPWDLGAYLELLQGFIQQGLIDWGGMKHLKTTVLGVLGQVRNGNLTLEEFQAQFGQS